MKSSKYAFASAASLVLILLSTAPSAFAASTSSHSVEIDVMTHLCDSSVKNLSDFQNLTNGLDPVAGFANQVLHCPSTVLKANQPVAGSVADPQTNFDYTVTGEHSAPLTLSSARFSPEQLCESDINKDVNGDGTISSSTCLDTSEYHFNGVNADNGKVDVQETIAPQGFHYGALLLTPVQIDMNNDAQSVLATDDAKGLIKLDTTNDKDKVITLHVYNFANSDNSAGLVNGLPASVGPTGSSTATTTGMGGGMGSTTSATLLAQVKTLQAQVLQLEALINKLIAQLSK